jgi:predicted dehydrogenase
MALNTVVFGFGRAADTLGDDTRMRRWFPKATHAAILSEHPEFAWTAVVDPDTAARRRAERSWDVSAVGDVAALADPAAFECAVIATPPAHRAGIVERLPNLKAVMLEKPAGADLAAAESFARICAARRIAVQVNYWRRGVAGFDALANGGLAQRIGEVRAVFGVYGGGVRNTGSHMIDFVRFLLGDVARAARAGEATEAPNAPHAGDRAAVIDMVLANGAPVRLAPIDFRDYREASLDIWGSKGRLAIEQESLVTRFFPCVANRGLEDAREIASDAPETLDIPVGDAFVRLYDNLAAAARDGAALASPLSSALATERLIDDILADAPPAVRARTA